ncbi:MAG: peroxide stress protein YaaA, partial [Bacteroidales bacterium]|nr:peroxide stress protein YaaA [Bacteroidales bacterium]
MLIIISPAKTLDYKTPFHIKGESTAPFLKESEALITELKKLKPNDISSLMKV